MTQQAQAVRKTRTKVDFVEMAKERNARVILHNTPDTYPLTEMARFADQGIRRLRNRVMITLSPEKSLPLLQEYNDALKNLSDVIEKICELTDIKYRVPRALVSIEKGAEAKAESQAESQEQDSEEKAGSKKKSK